MAMQTAEHRVFSRGLGLALLVLAAGLPPIAAAADEQPAAETRIGCTVRVALPITGATTERVRRFVDRALNKYPADENRLVLIFEFEVPPKQAEFGRGSKFGAAWDLADLLTSKQLQGVHTVAYVPQSIQGHAVLAVMACDEILMAKQATIGLAGVDGEAAADVDANYERIAKRRRTIPAEVALWMLDKSREVLVADTIEAGRQFVTPAGLTELKKKHTVKPSPRKLHDPLDPQGSLAAEAGVLTGNEAWKLGFATALAERRLDLAKALDLPPQDVEEDPGMVGELKAFQVNLTGLINADAANRAERMMVEAVEKKGANFICLWIDSPGGSIDDSIAVGQRPRRTSTARQRPHRGLHSRARPAPTPRWWPWPATEVVWPREPCWAVRGPASSPVDDLKMTREVVADPTAPGGSLLVAGGGDGRSRLDRLPLHPAGRSGVLLQREPRSSSRNLQAEPWNKGKQVTVPGEPFQVDGEQAVEYRLASARSTISTSSSSPTAWKTIRRCGPGLGRLLIEALASPGVAVVAADHRRSSRCTSSCTRRASASAGSWRPSASCCSSGAVPGRHGRLAGGHAVRGRASAACCWRSS